MIQQLVGKKALILVSGGVDEEAMSTVQRELLKAGAVLTTVGTEPGLVNSWNNTAWGLYFPVDVQISRALGADFDLLVVPSGARAVQKLAANPHAERIISSFVAARKPMCFIGDASALLEKTGHAGVAVATSLKDLPGAVPAPELTSGTERPGMEPMQAAA